MESIQTSCGLGDAMRLLIEEFIPVEEISAKARKEKLEDSSL